MPRDANGNYVLPAGNPVDSATIIQSDWANDTMGDLEVEMQDSLSRSGKGGMSAPLKTIPGSAAQPSQTFTDFPQTGVYAFSATDMRVTVAGVDRMRWLGANAVPQIWDNDTSMWVNLDSQIVTQVNDNLLINGGFDIWQRATSVTNPTTANEYNTVDRWRFRRDANATGMNIERTTSGTEAGQFTPAKIYRTDGDVNTDALLMLTQIESADWERLAGKEVTLSARLRLGSQFSAPALTVQVESGTGVDETVAMTAQFPTGGVSILVDSSEVDVGILASYQTVSWTFTVPTDSREGYIKFAWVPTGTAGSTEDSVRFGYVKLEEGSTATAFTRAGGTLAGELAACQRYYEKSYNSDTVGGTVTINGAEYTEAQVSDTASWAQTARYKVSKRITPQVTLYGTILGTINSIAVGSSDVTATTSSAGQFGFAAYATPDAAANAGQAIRFQWTADAEL